MLLARMDEYSKAAWLGLTVLAFWIAWPLGLTFFAFLVGSGGTRAWREDTRVLRDRWFNLRGATGEIASWWSAAASQSSGNNAFDAYRKTELDHLEGQEKEFKTFLNRLRQARDKEEFDRFMAEQQQAVAKRPSFEQLGS